MSVRTKTRRTKIAAKKRSTKAKERSIPWREVFKEEIEDYSEAGLMLRGSRGKADVTQKELAAAIGVSQHHISEMENGKRTIGREMAKRLGAFFKTSYKIFL